MFGEVAQCCLLDDFFPSRTMSFFLNRLTSLSLGFGGFFPFVFFYLSFLLSAGRSGARFDVDEGRVESGLSTSPFLGLRSSSPVLVGPSVVFLPRFLIFFPFFSSSFRSIRS